jgi:hypothetical protein
VPHGAHDDRKIAGPLQHPGSVIVATTVQDEFFRKSSFKPRLPEFLVHGRQMSRSRESREDPALFRLRRINKESVSIVIVVCFAIKNLLSETGRVLKTSAACPRGGEEVLTNALKVSDNFSQVDNSLKTVHFGGSI